ncbi:MAG: hypothetical protein BMS9Abin29_0661 [Gemmatimonadota bacterium]|nr:MAG: hypothetical protein BMS9Abin29_0661 [Gemmatimonadota bacterium]
MDDRPLRIAVIGAGDATSEDVACAESVGRLIGERGGVLICGGLGGVMEAAARGCALAGGLTIGILPGREAAGANTWIRLPLATAMGEGRNVLVVRSAEAVIAVGGSWGTLSEIALARKIGRPVVLLGTPPAEGLDATVVADAQQAVEWAVSEVHRMREPGDVGGL